MSEALPRSGGASFGARGQGGSGETELTSEAEGIGRGGVCVRASGGVGRDRTYARGPLGSGEMVFASEPWGVGRAVF